MTIGKTFTYKTFNPNTNSFDDEHKRFYKEADKGTVKRLKIFKAVQFLCMCLILPCLILTFACAAMIEEISLWFLLGFIGGLCLVGSCIYYGIDMDNRENAIIDEFRDNNFDEEEAECETYNAEQKAIAILWRQAHPFEEKIRRAQTRGSSVDIAEMVKEYIKLQKGE